MELKFKKIDKNNLNEIISKYTLFLFRIRNSRLKAKSLAIMEAFSLLDRFGAIVLQNSPMGDVKGVFGLGAKKANAENAKNLFHLLGYSNQVMEISFDNASGVNNTDLLSINQLSFKGMLFDLNVVYQENYDDFIAEAPDHREFKLISEDGQIKTVKGYRGDGTETGKRALPRLSDLPSRPAVTLPHLCKKETCSAPAPWQGQRPPAQTP